MTRVWKLSHTKDLITSNQDHPLPGGSGRSAFSVYLTVIPQLHATLCSPCLAQLFSFQSNQLIQDNRKSAILCCRYRRDNHRPWAPKLSLPPQHQSQYNPQKEVLSSSGCTKHPPPSFDHKKRNGDEEKEKEKQGSQSVVGGTRVPILKTALVMKVVE
jgi:hypothetical protein